MALAFLLTNNVQNAKTSPCLSNICSKCTYVDIIIKICFSLFTIFLCKDIDDDDDGGVVKMHVKCNLNMVPSRFHILKIRIIQMCRGANCHSLYKTLPLIDVNSYVFLHVL